MTETQRLAFVLPNLSGGGAARVAAILSGEWVKTGHEVHLVTYEEPGTEPLYPLDARIVRHQIGLSVSPKGLPGFISNNVRRVFKLRRIFRAIRPTGIIAFLCEANIGAVLAGNGLGAPILISERNHPAHHSATRIRSTLRARVYPFATRLCVQTEDIRSWFLANLGIEASVIPNPVQLPQENRARASGSAPGARRRAISLGRLEPQKGYDGLIEAFAMIASDVPDWDIVIHGEGAQRAALEQQVKRFGLAGRVFLPGVTKMPMDELRDSDLYLHPARYEGFPNAVLEALSVGLCVVATDCPGATGEILGRGKHGILVPVNNTRALADAMCRVMQDETLRADYAARSRDAVRIYAPDAIATRWLCEIEKCQVSFR